MLLLINNSSIPKIYIRLLKIYGLDCYTCGIDICILILMSLVWLKMHLPTSGSGLLQLPIIFYGSNVFELPYSLKAKIYFCGLDENMTWCSGLKLTPQNRGWGFKIDAVMVVVHYVVGNQRSGLVWVVIWVPGACASKYCRIEVNW